MVRCIYLDDWLFSILVHFRISFIVLVFFRVILWNDCTKVLRVHYHILLLVSICWTSFSHWWYFRFYSLLKFSYSLQHFEFRFLFLYIRFLFTFVTIDFCAFIKSSIFFWVGVLSFKSAARWSVSRFCKMFTDSQGIRFSCFGFRGISLLAACLQASSKWLYRVLVDVLFSISLFCRVEKRFISVFVNARLISSSFFNRIQL